VSAQYCAFCGNPLPAVGTYCPSCGAARPGATTAAPLPGPGPGIPSGFAPGPAYGAASSAVTQPGPSAATRVTDARALSLVTWAAVLSLLGSLVGIAVASATNLGGLIAVTSTTSGTSVSLPSPWVWVALLVSDAAFALTEILLFRRAFRELSGVDRRFSTPATLALLAFVGAALALVGGGLLLDALYQAVNCAGSGNPISSSCLLTGTFWGGTALIGLGAVVAVIGYIGILLGIWRLGTRYGDALFKVGAILLIFPVLNIIAAALILIGARADRRQVERASTVDLSPR